MTETFKRTLLLTAILGLQLASASVEAAKAYVPGRVIVANRTSGTLSIIDEKTGTLLKNVSVAGKFARPPEPMYVNYVAKLNRLLVNDRANNQIIALDADNYRVLDTAPIGAGAFHMWTGGNGKQTWAVNDVDKTISVIDPKTMDSLLDEDLPIPSDLKDKGGKPHDILLDKNGKYAFATIVGVGGSTDKDVVLQYSTKTFKEIARYEVGKDPHVGILNNGKQLYVPTQNASKVYVLDPAKKLALLKEIDVPGAHGATWSPNNKFFYTSNLPAVANGNGNKDALWTIDTKTMAVVNSTAFPDKTTYPDLKAAHNLTINSNGTKLYLTHSGHEDGDSTGDVSIYDINATDGQPILKSVVSVGINPFGITYVPGK